MPNQPITEQLSLQLKFNNNFLNIKQNQLMKKNLLITTAFCLFGIVLFAQTPITIAQWTFPTGVDTIDKLPDVSISQNAKMAIFAQDTTAWPKTILRTLTYTNGATNLAATATKWQNGKDAKLWSIKLKTNKASNLTLSSKQRSGGATPGPKYWKIQAQISGQSWVDLADVTCGNDWTTGAVTDLPLPASFNNLSSSIYIRWIVVSDSSVGGTIVDSLGVSKIDDIIVKGTTSTDIDDDQSVNEVTFYPNPNNAGILYFDNNNAKINSIKLFNTQGQLLMDVVNTTSNSIDIQNLKSGLYFIRTELEGDQKPLMQKLIVQ